MLILLLNMNIRLLSRLILCTILTILIIRKISRWVILNVVKKYLRMSSEKIKVYKVILSLI
jgi:hypothetical protein